MILRLLTTSIQHRVATLSPGNVLTRIAVQIPKFPIVLSQLRANLSTTGRLAVNPVATRAYDINTKVVKDVMLYKYDNPRFYRILNIFAITQFLFWGYLSHFAYNTLRDTPVPEGNSEELAWYERINLGENKYRNGIAIMSFLIGRFEYANLSLEGLFYDSYHFRIRNSLHCMDVHAPVGAIFNPSERRRKSQRGDLWTIR